jgi:hypothetical protein
MHVYIVECSRMSANTWSVFSWRILKRKTNSQSFQFLSQHRLIFGVILQFQESLSSLGSMSGSPGVTYRGANMAKLGPVKQFRRSSNSAGTVTNGIQYH